MPHPLLLTIAERGELDRIRSAAKVRHEKARKAAARRGRHNYPELPYECSWAYEEQFRRERRLS